MLPEFRYHPDPVGSGAFHQGETKTCFCCGKVTDLWYDGPFCTVNELAGDDVCLCPACIADGPAAKKGFTFNDPKDRLLGEKAVSDPERLSEWKFRTPNFYTWNYDFWYTHCGDFCAYLGNVGWKELEEAGITEQVAETYEADLFGAFDELRNCMGKDCSIEGHLFRCLHCGKYFLSVDAD